MIPKSKSGKARNVSKKDTREKKSEITKEKSLKKSNSRRRPEKSPESIAREVEQPLPNSKKIKELSYIPPPIQAPIQKSENSIEEEPINPRFQPLNPLQNKNYPDSFFNMKPNFSFGKNARDLEEEYRLLEELINTENRYHALKFKQIITDLKSQDEFKILEAVTHLSTELSMAQEENFGSFQLDFLIPELINCLQMENPEIMMHSVVSITHILDIMPAAGKILVNSGGVEVLCQKMQNFEYIDVAESAIKALEKVSYENGLSILNAGGMEIMITMIDFFVSPTQKLIISVISNIFRLVSSENMLKEKILPILPVVLSYTQLDPSRQDIMYNMISRLADRVVKVCGEDYEKKKEYLEIIAQDNMIGNFCLILNEQVDNFDLTKVDQLENILKTLNKFCYFSLKLCMEAFNAGLINILDKLINILEGPAAKENKLSMLAYETISLVNSILALRVSPHPMIGKIAAHIGIKISENANVEGRIEMLKEHPYVIQGILEKIGVRLPGIFENNAGTFFKYLVLISFQKLIEFSDVEDLRQKLDFQVVANFISKLTTFNDIMIIAVTLLIIELLITKLPETFLILTREGIVDYIKSLSSTTEVNKLEAYSVVQKRYNPLEALKQFTSTINKLTANVGMQNEFLANLEAESQKIEMIMQQLQSLRHPESISESSESKTLSSAEEGSPTKSPQLIKNSIPSQMASFENKALPNLNTKPSNDEMNIEDEVLTEKQAQAQPVDKMTELRREIAAFAAGLYMNIKDEIQKKSLPSHIPTSIINKLEEISLALEQNQWNPAEFGQKHFQKYLDLIIEHGGITNYELKSSKLLKHLLNFLFDNLLSTKPATINIEPLQSTPTKETGNALKKFKFKIREEEKKINMIEEEKPKEPEKPVFELTDLQCQTILGRIISFLYYFKKVKNKEKQEIYLQDFLKNLQEMLANSDQFSLDTARNVQEYENTLNSDLRFLAQRVKFKAQYSSESKSERKKSLGTPELLKNKSTKIDEEKKIFPTSLETQTELYYYKDSIFKEVPLLALSVEQFGTLEVIEDYLLNKLNSKEDLNGGLFGRNFNDFANQKFEENNEGNSDEDLSLDKSEDMDQKGSVNKVPVNNPKSKSPGALSLQKSHSHMKTKYESKFVKNDKKKWVDRLTGKEINFKKYLELKFFIGDEEVNKTNTVYEIFSKHRSKTGLKFGGNEEIIIQYKLVTKKVDSFEFSSGEKSQYKQSNPLCLDHKTLLQNLLSRIASLDMKTNDQNLKDIIQMIAFIHELNDLDKRIRSPSSVFNSLLIELKNKNGLETFIEAYKGESRELAKQELVDKQEFVNKKISAVLHKYVNDPLTLAAGMIPDALKDISEKAPFLLDFKSKFHYYKNACSHISRALYYICHSNKSRLKELESTRIGKIHRKKIKVIRDKILENAVVNFETYGYKKSILEFEFQDEEGTGLGPTLEYYAIVASEMKNPDHNLWRNTISNLLFPSPIDPYDLKYPDPNKVKRRQPINEKKRDFEKFQLIFRCAGTMIARSILDERMVDLPFHSVFWDIILEKPLYLEDVAKIDPGLGETLLCLKEIVNKKQEIERDPNLNQIEKSERIKELKFKGSSIEDLALNFTLPGFDEIDLIENGEDMPVTLSNLDQYVSILARYILLETLKSQVSAFKEGFDKVLPIQHLKIFESDEIEALVCGGSRDEDWDVKTLETNFIPAHGYNANSKSFKNFIQIVASFTSEEKRLFLKFVTGAERLPYGGFKNLHPKMTIVKKQPNLQHEHPDEYLPSVMTCQNYVKLPDYSTIEVMQSKLLFSMKEGQHSFSLS